MNRRSVFVVRQPSPRYTTAMEYRTSSGWDHDLGRAKVWGRRQDAIATTVARHESPRLAGGDVVELTAFVLEPNEVAVVLPTHDAALVAVLADFLEHNGLLAQANILRGI
jgi:hypothetical protein